MNTISPIDLKKAASKLPSSPQIFSKLSQLMKDPDASLDDITDLVNTDSSLTIQVLKLSNSPAYASGVPIDTLDEAINRVGFSELFKLVGMAAASQVFANRNTTYNIDGSDLWENSLACGLAMEKLATKANMDPQEAYTIGLLRSMGKMVINTCVKDDPEYDKYSDRITLPLTEWEENNFGLTSATVAGFILISWNFPEHISNTISYQYSPEDDPRGCQKVFLLNLACSIAHVVGDGLPGEVSYWNPSSSRLKNAGVTLDDYEEVKESVSEGIKEIMSSIAV
ncbi:HDOD domain-containing protein [Puniceicoccaceae bacterium K14]|nr:HDOD domain-containing protein [Puniceicoccaceae bacterium K14]